MDMRQAAEALEKKLHADPSNAEGWELYARTESMLGDYQKAEAGYRQAIGLGRKTPELFAAYGEMLVLQADGIVSPAAHDAFTQSLAIDPKNDVARYYLALGDEQAGEEQRAIDRWTALAADIPDDSPMRESIARGVAEAARQGGLTAPALPKGTPEPQQDATAGSQAGAGPNQDQMSAAAAMPEGERKQMIQTMVTQLAARLQTSPDDVDGWLRLGRSYAVLGEPDKAVDAFEHAVKLKPDDATIKLQEFDTLVAKLQPSDPLPPRALELLQQVAASDPDQPEALWYLGVQAARDGKPDVARADWTKLLGQLPADGEDAKMVKQALDALTK
jgi:cytochrome c-type biogenesis protein CcmH